jgi:hypothetical protein
MIRTIYVSGSSVQAHFQELYSLSTKMRIDKSLPKKISQTLVTTEIICYGPLLLKGALFKEVFWLPQS